MGMYAYFNAETGLNEDYNPENDDKYHEIKFSGALAIAAERIGVVVEGGYVCITRAQVRSILSHMNNINPHYSLNVHKRNVLKLWMRTGQVRNIEFF